MGKVGNLDSRRMRLVGKPMWQEYLALVAIEDIFEFLDDFLTLPIDDATAKPTGYTTTLDAGGGATLLNGGTGGVLKAATHSDDNDEITLEQGTGATGNFFKITKNSGKKLWFEVRMKCSQHADMGVFVGLAEENLGANLMTDNTMAPADKDYAAFRILSDHSDEIDFAVNKSGAGGEKEVKAKIATNADDWHVFGFYFDGINTITPYADGVASTIVAADDAKFPGGEGLAVIIGVKTGENVAKDISIDYIKVAQQR